MLKDGIYTIQVIKPSVGEAFITAMEYEVDLQYTVLAPHKGFTSLDQQLWHVRRILGTTDKFSFFNANKSAWLYVNNYYLSRYYTLFEKGQCSQLEIRDIGSGLHYITHEKGHACLLGSAITFSFSISTAEIVEWRFIRKDDLPEQADTQKFEADKKQLAQDRQNLQPEKTRLDDDKRAVQQQKNANDAEKKRLEDEKKANLVAKNALDAEKKKVEEDAAASGKPAWEKKADADKILATYTLLTRFTPNYDKLVNVTLKGFENLANQLHLTYQLGYGEHNAPVTIVSTTTANPAEQEWQLIPVNNKFRIIADKPQGALSYIALSEDLERVFASHTWSQPNQLAEQPDSLWEVRLDSGSNILLVVPNTGLVVTRDSKTAYARLAYAADTADQKWIAKI